MTNVSRLKGSVAVLANVLLLAGGASAQETTAPFLRWNVDASVGAFNLPLGAIDDARRTAAVNRTTLFEQEWSVVYGVDIGRYWTTHFKTDVGLTLHRQFSTSDVEMVPFAPLPEGAMVFTDKTLDLTTLSLAGAYQFREDAFVHPYLSAGVRLGWSREHRFRDERTYTDYIGPYPSRPIRYTAPALDEYNDELLARPFVGGGSKFYVNTRLYLRSGASVIFGDGTWDLTLGVGMGTDF